MITRRNFLSLAGAGILGVLEGCELQGEHYVEEKGGVLIEHNVSYSKPSNSENIFGTLEKELIFGGEKVLDVYSPLETEQNGKSVLMIHGGGWIGGDKAWKQIPRYMENLAENGFVAFSINYRVAPKHLWPTMIQDCGEALDFVVQNSERYGFEQNKVRVIGTSSGGHLATLLSCQNETAGKIDKLVSLYGIYDLTRFFGEEDTKLSEFFGEFPNLEGSYERTVFGTTIEENRELFEDASPIFNLSVEGAYPRMRLIHGYSDELVEFSQAEEFLENASLVGADCDLVRFDGAHGFPKEYVQGNWGEIVKFFGED